MNCSICGSFNSDTSHYCTNCGMELNTTNQTVAQNNHYRSADRINNSLENRKSKSPMIALVFVTVDSWVRTVV